VFDQIDPLDTKRSLAKLNESRVDQTDKREEYIDDYSSYSKFGGKRRPSQSNISNSNAKYNNAEIVEVNKLFNDTFDDEDKTDKGQFRS
jgi:hypothetical protein